MRNIETRNFSPSLAAQIIRRVNDVENPAGLSATGTWPGKHLLEYSGDEYVVGVRESRTAPQFRIYRLDREQRPVLLFQGRPAETRLWLCGYLAGRAVCEPAYGPLSATVRTTETLAMNYGVHRAPRRK